MMKTIETVKGKTFVDAKGMTLYTFDNAGGKSMCNGPCAENWPPLMASGDAKPGPNMTILVRDDGKKMWAYKGKPFYMFKKDTAAGDINGDGFLNGRMASRDAVSTPREISPVAGTERRSSIRRTPPLPVSSIRSSHDVAACSANFGFDRTRELHVSSGPLKNSLEDSRSANEHFC